jgi:hypothetical protein
MIARHWRGWTSVPDATAYENLLRKKVLPGDELYAPTGPCRLNEQALPQLRQSPILKGTRSLQTASARRLNSDRHMVSRVAIIKVPSQRSERSDPHHTVNRVLERTGGPFGLSIRWSSSFAIGRNRHLAPDFYPAPTPG